MPYVPPASSGSGVPTSRLINTTAPVTGGGDLTADRTIAMAAATDSVNGYLSSTDHTTLTGLSGSATGVAPAFVAVGVPVIAWKSGIDMKTVAVTDIFTVAASRTFVATNAKFIVTAVTSGVAVAFVYNTKESSASNSMTSASAHGSSAPTVGQIHISTNIASASPFTCTATNKVQANIQTAFTTSTSVTGTFFVEGYYSA